MVKQSKRHPCDCEFAIQQQLSLLVRSCKLRSGSHSSASDNRSLVPMDTGWSSDAAHVPSPSPVRSSHRSHLTMKLSQIARVYHTIRYLKPVQVTNRLQRRLMRPRWRPMKAPPLRPLAASWTAALRAACRRSSAPQEIQVFQQRIAVESSGRLEQSRSTRIWSCTTCITLTT